MLEKHTTDSLGEAPDYRKVRIMVTMPSEAASDPNLVRDFLNRGMNIMRINCAHDSAEEWLRMVENLRAAQEETGKVLQDCLRPRWSKIANRPGFSGSRIIRWKPRAKRTRASHNPCLRRILQRGTTLLRVKRSQFRLRARFFGMPRPEMSLNSPIPAAASARFMSLTSTSHRCVCTNDRTGYVIQGTKLRLLRGKELLCEDEVGTLPEVEYALSLSVGDDLMLDARGGARKSRR